MDTVENGPPAIFYLVCKDKLLMHTAVERMNEKKGFIVFGTMSDLQSYLTLLGEQLEASFVKSVIDKAPAFFFTEGNPASAVYTMKIDEQILKQLPSPIRPLPVQVSIGHAITREHYVKDSKTIVRDTAYIKRTDTSTFHWKTTLEHAQILEQLPTDGLTMPPVFEPLHLRVNKFEVYWRSRVDATGTLHDAVLEDVKWLEDDERDSQSIMRFGFEGIHPITDLGGDAGIPRPAIAYSGLNKISPYKLLFGSETK